LSKGGIQIYGANNTPFNLDELKDFINSLGILNCILEIYGPVDEEDILNALDRRTVYKKAIIVATKADIPNVEMNIEMLKQLAGKLPIVFTSALAKKGKEKLGDTIFSSLGLIRVWTKKDGKISERALVLPKGATVKDAAEKIHSDFVKKFKYAIVEREGGKVKRFRVGLNFTLEDNDVLLIYTTE